MRVLLALAYISALLLRSGSILGLTLKAVKHAGFVSFRAAIVGFGGSIAVRSLFVSSILGTLCLIITLS